MTLTQWEYREEEDQSHEQLNALGAAGWELVAIYPHGEITIYTFKRLVENNWTDAQKAQARLENAVAETNKKLHDLNLKQRGYGA